MPGIPMDMTDTPEIIQITQAHLMAEMGGMAGVTVMAGKAVKEPMAAMAAAAETLGRQAVKAEKVAAGGMQPGMIGPVMEAKVGVAMTGAVTAVAEATAKMDEPVTVVAAETQPETLEVEPAERVGIPKPEKVEMVVVVEPPKQLGAAAMAAMVGMGDQPGKVAMVVTRQGVAQAGAEKEEKGHKDRRPSFRTTLITTPAWKTSRLQCPSPISPWQTLSLRLIDGLI